MEFSLNDDAFFLYIEDRGNKSVVKLEHNYEWTVDLIDGVYPSLGTLWADMDIDEIVTSLRKEFDVAEIIDEVEIDDYME